MSTIDSLRKAASSAGEAFWREASTRAEGASRELARRTELARQAAPSGISGPPLRLLLGELGAVRPRRSIEAEGYRAIDPQPVMVLPGFGAHPFRMKPLLKALDGAGHGAHGWGLGVNLGPTAENFAFLQDRVTHLNGLYGRPVTLVGWSLGGLFAREIARRQPEAVGKVITLGTPFSGDPHANNVWRAYQFVTGHAVESPPVECASSAKPPVPTIALWSPKDGVISPRSACGWPSERDRAVAMRCSHLGFPNDPDVIAEVLRQIDIEEPAT